MSENLGTGGDSAHLGPQAGGRLAETGRILVVTRHFLSRRIASGGIMQRLLEGFDPKSYAVLTAATRPHAMESHANVHGVAIPFRWLWRGDPLVHRPRRRMVRREVQRLVERLSPRAILAVFPDYYFLDAAVQAASGLHIPLGVYLHDTVTEGFAGTFLAQAGEQLNQLMLDRAQEILVLNQGLADLFLRKHGRPSVVVPHPYTGPIAVGPPQARNPVRALWAGSLYSPNDSALGRVQEALTRLSIELHLVTNSSRVQCRWHGLRLDNLHLRPLQRWEDYLAILRDFNLLIVTLNWPGESRVHEDELSTAFPTKVAEYLAAGVPMLVHCPAHYFLARFVMAHDCGRVVSAPDPAVLEREIRELLRDPAQIERLVQNGLRCAREFGSPRHRETFQAACFRLTAGSNRRS